MQVLRFLLLNCFLIIILIAGASESFAQQQGYDISGGGQPTITGGLNGTVTGSGDPTQNLAVTINFGEVTPANSNKIVKVTVPIAIRSIQPYQVTATATTSFSADQRAVQATDIGFGINNMRPLGIKGQQCTRSTHIITPLFNNDPALNMTINTAGRVAYPSTVSNVGSSTLLMSGHKLTQGTSISRTAEDGWVFNAVFTIAPSFYASGTFSLTLNFNIAPGPNVQC
jgi:hypothetical protein